MTKRLLSFLFAALLFLTAIPFVTTTTVNAAYENTYVNTGNQAVDIIGIAKTQLGYKEESGGYTKYGAWYGLPYADWCGMFVSWCANQAGVPTSVLRKYARSNPEGYGLTRLDGRTYRPKPGDLFFYRSLAHVGLVYYVEGDYFYTLEGNAGSGSNRVVSNRHKISDYLFGSPKYYGSGDHSYTTDYEKAHPHKEYKYCSHCGDKYYTGDTKSNSDCITCIQNACSHNYSSWSKASDSKHSRTCSKCDKVESAEHKWVDGTILAEANCSKAGSKEQSCSVCEAERTVSIPKTDSHTFGDNIYIDDENHRHSCTVCSFAETEAHTENDEWITDEQYHWYECSECDERYSIGKHVFPDGCESACETCGYVSEEGHLLANEPSSDESGHWYDCDKCDKKVDFKEHNFHAECAENCQDCSYVRQTTHSFSAAWMSNGVQHWQECNVCGLKQNMADHNPDPSAEDWETQLCTVCSFMLRSADDHVHSYHKISHDSRTHWGTCACGHDMGVESHTWSMQTQQCSVCGINTMVSKESAVTERLMYWAAIVLGGIGLFTTLALIISIPGKKRRAKAPATVKAPARSNSH